MKKIFLLPAAFIFFSFKTHHSNNSITSNTDTAIIAHVLDGNVNEWPAEKFEEDKSTSIKYAVDNDANDLFVAMIIPQFPTQLKMMRQGMELYVDIKGKKKEGKGVEFPLKSESNFGGGDASNSRNFQSGDQKNGDNGQRTFDKSAVRSRYAMNLFALKLFGFSDGEDEPAKQGLTLEGSVNVSFSWDSSEVMYVEYRLPLSMLDKTSLNQKIISVGWKLNGVEALQVTGTTSGLTSTTSSGPPRGRNFSRTTGPTNGNSGPSQQDRDNFMKEQYIWTKYTINIPSN